MRRIEGFSLIEILVVVGLFGVVGAISVQAIFSSLGTSRKAEVSIEVRENAENAIATIERRLRNAKSIDSCAPVMSQISYTNVDDTTGTITCLSGTTGRIDIDGARATSDDVSVTSCSFSCSPGGIDTPPQVDIDISVQDIDATGTEQTQMDLNTKVLLRTY